VENRAKILRGKFGETWSDFSSSALAARKNESSHFRPIGFLNNQEVVGQVCDSKDCWEVAVAQTDGSVVSHYRIPKSLGFSATSGPVIVTKEGRCFATELVHESDLSDWWDYDVDMWSFGVKYLVYVWDAKFENPVAKITLTERLHGYCFTEGETPALAVLDGPNLKLVSIDTKASQSLQSIHYHKLGIVNRVRDGTPAKIGPN
jgi:hypothetical protein